MTVVHLDADSLVYSHGSMADTKRYNIGGAPFQYKKECLKFCEKHSLNPDDIQITLSPDPLLVPMNSISNDIEKIRLAAGGPDATIKLHLTGGNQFRDAVATIKPYKGNRSPDKPVWYNELREHMRKSHGACIHEVIEADDAVVMEQFKDPSCIIAHIDKDIDQSPGLHYNFNHKESYTVTEHQGLVSFYTQMVTGDGVDNIPGVFFLTGKRSPNKIRERLAEHETAEEMFRDVFKIYQQAIFVKSTGMSPEDLYNWLTETGVLLYMLRTPDDYYNHPVSLEDL